MILLYEVIIIFCPKRSTGRPLVCTTKFIPIKLSFVLEESLVTCLLHGLTLHNYSQISSTQKTFKLLVKENTLVPLQWHIYNIGS